MSIKHRVTNTFSKQIRTQILRYFHWRKSEHRAGKNDGASRVLPGLRRAVHWLRNSFTFTWGNIKASFYCAGVSCKLWVPIYSSDTKDLPIGCRRGRAYILARATTAAKVHANLLEKTYLLFYGVIWIFLPSEDLWRSGYISKVDW